VVWPAYIPSLEGRVLGVCGVLLASRSSSCVVQGCLGVPQAIFPSLQVLFSLARFPHCFPYNLVPCLFVALLPYVFSFFFPFFPTLFHILLFFMFDLRFHHFLGGGALFLSFLFFFFIFSFFIIIFFILHHFPSFPYH